eukprot:CAMPEP_0196234066 /NCGR_PEP_ID=MMETSP0913-20130531/4275_1 /TAXON_ID=49265 /ORGANISM="Thalassiosira rotula, Strain GSO102" /LENGTH=61 /DNA_ID=CAMNT_0041515023 /DNA_START=507 /DNA_END=692 /DNA_ORIENTATION=-
MQPRVTVQKTVRSEVSEPPRNKFHPEIGHENAAVPVLDRSAEYEEVGSVFRGFVGAGAEVE